MEGNISGLGVLFVYGVFAIIYLTPVVVGVVFLRWLWKKIRGVK